MQYKSAWNHFTPSSHSNWRLSTFIATQDSCVSSGDMFHLVCLRHLDPSIMERLLMETPKQMVKFKAYKRDGAPPAVDRRSTRVKNRNRLALGAWAKWLVESIKFMY